MTARSSHDASQVMIVTGAASGIGRCLAGQLANRGHRLVLADLNLAMLEAAAAEAGWSAETTLLRSLDVREASQWQSVVDEAMRHWGRLDVLWNVAGYLRPGYVHQTEYEQIALHLDTNAKGTIVGSQITARMMVEAGRGHIVNVASMAALTAVPGIALYSASKFAVRGFTLALAQELRPHGVFATVVCPDAVRTPMLDLQLDYHEAALTFSAAKPLEVERLCELLVGRVLQRKPVEAIFPWHRGWIAKAANLSPKLAHWMGPWLTRVGRVRQEKMRSQRAQARIDEGLGPVSH